MIKPAINKVNHFQKKSYLQYLQLKKSFRALPIGKQVALALLALVIFSYPGQNYYQALSLHPQEPKTQVFPISLSKHSIPINNDTNPPRITAQSIFVLDPDSGTILFQKNPNTPLHPASTTKIMTALVALNIYNLDQVLTVKTGDQAIGNSVDLIANDQLTVSSLLYALLVASGNDAALTLAENHPQGYQGFIDDMNQKAQDFHLKNTHFSNVSGIESYSHKTTVHDLAILTKEAIKNSTFNETIATKSITVSNINGSNTYSLTSTNKLLGELAGVVGVKTGWTENAGECLVTLTSRDDRNIITVVLNSADRFGESTQLINWAFDSHVWQDI